VAGRIAPTELVELEAHRRLAGQGPAETIEVGGAVALAVPGVPSTMVNRVTGLGLHAPATEEHLDSIEEFFRAHRAHFAVAVAPHAEPPELTGMLAERGYTSGYAWTKFTRPVDEPTNTMTDLRIELVGADRGADFAGVVRDGYELPAEIDASLAALPGAEGYSCFVAYADEQPAAAAALFVHGDAGWLSFAATRPEFRRHGGQTALLEARVRRAAELGATLLVTETGERLPGRPSNSYRNIVRSGFRPAYVRPNFLAPG
jgi:GNAT superfamily N-acetyltransferase